MPVPDFSVGEVFTAAAADSIGMWLIKTQTVAAGQTQVDVTSCFSTNYDSYFITWSGGTGNGNNVLNVRLLSGTTPATTTYYYGYTGAYYAGAAAVGGGANVAQWFAGHSTANDLSLEMHLFDPFLTKYTRIHSSWHSVDVGGVTIGEHRQSTSYDGFRLITGAGTIGGGTIRVYGYRN